MDRYQKVEKPKPETPINENEIRITAQGLVRNYISYATNLLQALSLSSFEKRGREIVLKAMGQAISKTVAIAEIIKRRIPQLHQDTAISSVSITDVWEPIEEGLLPVEQTRHVSMISVTLSTRELDKNSPGYQAPSQIHMVVDKIVAEGEGGEGGEEDGVGAEVDMETTKKMTDIQTGAKVVGVAMMDIQTGVKVVGVAMMGIQTGAKVVVVAMMDIQIGAKVGVAEIGGTVVPGMKEGEVEGAEEAMDAAVDGWAGVQGVVAIRHNDWGLVCFALAECLPWLSGYHILKSGLECTKLAFVVKSTNFMVFGVRHIEVHVVFAEVAQPLRHFDLSAFS
ncbi:hypothetical protein TEA_014305 [Camellia sinensis var. sinensis]|uniref:DNA/RNA-binding protein Alba-like domain-containing protein n=1 Tax=Camellia sinensis var. sinensis TaxID=542762 RepID=A0A4V3WNT9_CAMSN|nr:hypothetical protein TEA_014305 [Camellia sinensis var. sinensis]